MRFDILAFCIIALPIIWFVISMILNDYATSILCEKRKSINVFLAKYNITLAELPMTGPDDAPCQIRFSVIRGAKSGINSWKMLRYITKAKRAPDDSETKNVLTALCNECAKAERVYTEQNRKRTSL